MKVCSTPARRALSRLHSHVSPPPLSSFGAAASMSMRRCSSSLCLVQSCSMWRHVTCQKRRDGRTNLGATGGRAVPGSGMDWVDGGAVACHQNTVQYYCNSQYTIANPISILLYTCNTAFITECISFIALNSNNAIINLPCVLNIGKSFP